MGLGSPSRNLAAIPETKTLGGAGEPQPSPSMEGVEFPRAGHQLQQNHAGPVRVGLPEGKLLVLSSLGQDLQLWAGIRLLMRNVCFLLK